jgi:hypothetical protein
MQRGARGLELPSKCFVEHGEGNLMSERLEAIERYEMAKTAYDRAAATLEAAKLELKEFGTFNEAGYKVDVSVIARESISWGDIKKKDPVLAAKLIEAGFVKKSESERLSVKMKGEEDAVF